jgi:hypothetical protein
MTVEELKAALDAALVALAAKPEDAALKATAEAAQTAYDEAVAAEAAKASGDPDESKLDEKTKAYLAKLRKENAGHRNKNKDLASKVTAEQERTKAILKAAGLLEEEKPEEKLAATTAQNESLAFHSAVLESAIEHGIPKEGLKYYQFLISEAVNELGEGEEISDEKLAEIVKEAKGFGGKKTPANSTVLDKNGKPIVTPDPAATGDMTLEKFCAMGVIERSNFYLKNAAQYEEFMKLAKAKKKFV